ncbi:MAG: DUF3352 domain-containing protein [Blastocatellia bacterium]
MKIAALLKSLLALLLVVGLAPTPLAAPRNARPAPLPAVAIQQDDDDDEGITFDTLLPADGYTLYIEARNIGALLRSADFRETFEPISPLLEQMGGAVEFKLVRLVIDNADRLQHSRVMFALNPTDTSLPSTLLAFELETEDEAEAFAAKAQESLAPLAPAARKSSTSQTSGAEPIDHPSTTPSVIRRTGKLVVLSNVSFTFKGLHGKSDRRMSDDMNFRAARDHLSSEPLFIYYDIALSERRKEGAPATVTPNTNSAREELTVVRPQVEPPPAAATTSTSRGTTRRLPAQAPAARNSKTVIPVPLPQAASQPPRAEQDLLGSLFNLVLSGSGQAQHNDALAVALALENDALVARALLIGEPGAAIGPVPFLSLPVCGPALSSEAANYLPADTGIFVVASLDWPRLYDLVIEQMRTAPAATASRAVPAQPAADFETRRAAFEKANHASLADVLTATLGNEIALSVPINYLGNTPLGRVPVNARAATTQPLMLIAVRDREALMSKLRPLLETVGVKLTEAKTTTEHVGDIEITSYGNLAYAFVNNYLLMAAKAASIRQALEARANNATLAASRDFQSYTQWQPRAMVAQVYVSAAVLKGLFPDPAQRNELMKDEAVKEFLARYRFDPEPITYAASAEGVGGQYELRIPRRLLMRFFAEIAASELASRVPRNESVARTFLESIKEQEKLYKTQHGRYATLDEMMTDQQGAEDKERLRGLTVMRDMIERYGYKFEMTAAAGGYEITMVPLEYGKSGRLSFYMDQSGVVRAGDHQGKAASSADPSISPRHDY